MHTEISGFLCFPFSFRNYMMNSYSQRTALLPQDQSSSEFIYSILGYCYTTQLNQAKDSQKQ